MNILFASMRGAGCGGNECCGDLELTSGHLRDTTMASPCKNKGKGAVRTSHTTGNSTGCQPTVVELKGLIL